MLGLLTCIIINSRDRFDHFQFIGLISITFIFTILTWVREIILSFKIYFIQILRLLFQFDIIIYDHLQNVFY